MNLIGRVLRPHGIKGYVRALPIKASIFDLQSGSAIICRRGSSELNLLIEEIKPHGRFVLIKFKGIDGIDGAEELRGFELFIEGETEDTLVGLDVWQGERKIGRVKEVMEIPMNTILIVEKSDGREVLIPFSLCKIEKDRIEADIPEGLEEL